VPLRYTRQQVRYYVMGVCEVRDVVAIRHVAFEDLGSFGHVLRDRGFEVTYLEPGRDNLQRVEQQSPDLLVVLGAPIGVNDVADYPFLAEEMALIRARLSRIEPVLGICLGAQLIAAALGSSIYPASQKEIGWAPVQLTPSGLASPLGELSTPVLHWHGDTFDLPAGAVHLASTPTCKNQAFAIANHVLGIQFHPEVLGGSIEKWLIGHAFEIAHTAGVSIKEIRADTQHFAASMETQNRRMFGRWLDRIPPRSEPAKPDWPVT
jgi:GMP synthase (glutamine-hydrolysing)